MDDLEFRRSSHSGGEGNCVEAAPTPDGNVAVRHSKRPDNATIIYTRAEWAAFVAGVVDGEFNF